MAKQIQRLSPEVEDKAFDLVLSGNKLEDIAKALGFKNAQALQRYKIQHPEFAEIFERARVAECELIEEEVRYVADKYNDKDARIKLEALTKILKWRDQKKYGEKTQIDMTVTVDISGSLDRAERRVQELSVTNVIAIQSRKEPGDSV